MSLDITVVEDLGTDDTVLVQDQGSGERQDLGLRVQDAEFLNRLAAGIREQRKPDRALLSKRREDGNIVVRDPDDLDASIFNLLEVALQLDQLPLAVRSPIGRSVEDQRDFLLFPDKVGQASGLA